MMWNKKIADFDGEHLFSVSGANYIAPKSSPVVTIPSLRGAGLITVFSLPHNKYQRVSREWIQSSVENYLTIDDVFKLSFLRTVVFYGAAEGDADVTTDAHEYLTQKGNERIVFLTEPFLRPGPYYCHGEELRDVWKLVDDTSGTCMVTLKPQSTSRQPFEPFTIKSPGSQFNSFAIPSRIKASNPTSPSCAGLRVVIKDNIHLKGIKTSVGNKAFHDTYPPSAESASCVQSMIDLGMVIVGKTKMTSFANWEEPVEYIDYQAPWNPRADGYQSPGGSSSGSAAAIASYDWLDIAIGTDNLPYGVGVLDSVLLGDRFLQISWDTAGVLARDLQQCRDFSRVWLSPEKLKSDPGPFTSIIWPTDYWSIIDSHQADTAVQFVHTIESVLNIKCTEVSFAAAWKQSPPSDAQRLSLGDYTNDAAKAQCFDAYHNCDDFRARYKQLVGHAPYVSPANQELWSFAQNISKEGRDRDFARLHVFRQWLTRTVLTGNDSNALIIMPLESMTARYRDETPKFPRPPQPGVNALALAPVMKAPVISIPVAELPYHSRITNRQEMLPLVLAVMGPEGTDLALMDAMLRVMRDSGMPTVVKTGRSMFDEYHSGSQEKVPIQSGCGLGS
ncbi:amidase signature domain-containing protein [Nemania sp. NC0429]|nr:amidase signature domain-containing protein [Nemania sp. NC0429]